MLWSASPCAISETAWSGAGDAATSLAHVAQAGALRSARLGRPTLTLPPQRAQGAETT
jgi:hypothetical protein